MKKIIIILSLLILATGSVFFFLKKPAQAGLPICISDNELYPSLCKEAAADQTTFENFKRDPIYNLIQEHTTFEEGNDYLVQILSKHPFLLEKLDQFRKNDQIGNPRTFNYPFVGLFSPTTLRYMKVAGDLKKQFGDLEGWDVVEIGGDYGGQCKVLKDLFHFNSYTIIDLPECLELKKKYLEELGITDVKFYTPDNFPSHRSYDLILSNYSFTEYNKAYQKKLLQKVIKFSKNGFLTCNFYPKYYGVKSLPKVTLLKSLKRFGYEMQELPEEPLTGKDNFMLFWKEVK